jgi:hypothetical protein
MSTIRLTSAEIRARGWDALVAALGPSGARRFAMQTERGQGDFGARRHQMLGALSVDELLARMRWRPARRARRDVDHESSRELSAARARTAAS